MDNPISLTEENLIVSKFRELSEDRKQRLLDYAETLCNEEKSAKITKFPEDFLSEQDKESFKSIIDEFEQFIESEPTPNAIKALKELCEGIYEGEEELFGKHDLYLYGANKAK